MFSSEIGKIFTNTYFKKHLLTLSLPVPHWAGDTTILPTNSNSSKTVRVNVAFTDLFERTFEKLPNGMQVDGLCICCSQVTDV